MPTLALIGYGKMGRLAEQLAAEQGFEVGLRLRSFDNAGGQGITAEACAGIDVALEFSTPHAAVSNLLALAAAGVPTVTGTTGWLGELPQVSAAFAASPAGLVWSANYSIGVAVFRKVVEAAAASLGAQAEYGAWAWELHHAAKKDAPSGTLLHLVEAMRRAGYERPVDISSNRAGQVPGTHEIGFDSAADTITVRHTARNREGFVRGALKAAQWIIGRSGVYTFEDVLFGPAAGNTIRNTEM